MPSASAPLATSPDAERTAARYWPVPLVRAVPVLVMAAVVTFSRDHSPTVGLLSFGVATLVGGLLLALGTVLRLDDRSSRTLGLVQGVTSVVAGAAALVGQGGGLPFFVALVTGWALVTGALELVAGLRRRGRSPLARDWISVAALTLALAAVFLVVPLDYAQPLGGVERIEGVLTSSTVLVGVLGAYGAVVGVFLVIAALSLRWQTGAVGDRAAAHPGPGSPDTSPDGVQQP